MKIDNIKKPTEAEVEQKLRDYLKKKKMEISEAEIEDTVEYIISLFDDEWIAYSVKEGITDVDKAIREWYKDTVGLENWEKENGSLEGNPYAVDSSHKAIKSDLNFEKISELCDDLDFSVLEKFEDNEDDAFYVKLDSIGEGPDALEGVEIRFTENDDGENVIGVYEIDHKSDTFTAKHIAGEISKEDINEAVYDFLKENPQLLESSREFATSGCHGKGKDEDGKKKKEIKSSSAFGMLQYDVSEMSRRREEKGDLKFAMNAMAAAKEFLVAAMDEVEEHSDSESAFLSAINKLDDLLKDLYNKSKDNWIEAANRKFGK